MVLAALAASCSNEELELVNNSNEMAKGRFEIGQVELSLNNGVDSRYAVGPNFNDLAAELGDELGAALIDNWDGADHDNDYKYDYTLTNYIQTNYSFKFNGETWGSEAKMVEGNYFFYAPYNASHVTRAAVTAKFNAVQQLSLNADGSIDELSTIKELKESGEVMAIGHKFISRTDGKTVEANLLPIYAYPLVNFKNSYKPMVDGVETPTDLIINQIVISSTTGFPTETTFKFTDATSKTAISAESGVVAEFRDFTYYKSSSEPNKALKGDFAGKNGSKANYTADLMTSTATKTSSAIVVKAPANYTLPAGETMSFHVVVPAASYTDLDIEVYTNKGVFKVLEDGSLAIAAGKRYTQSDYNADGTLVNDPELPIGQVMNWSLAAINAAPANIVTSSADLATLIQNTTEETLDVKPLTEDIQINAAVMNAIKAKTGAFTLNVTAPATISTSLNSSATNKLIVFQKGAIVNEGTITINNKVEFEGALTKLNVKGGNVTLAATFDVATLEVNGGEVSLKSVVSTVVKGGTLTVAEITANGNIANNGGTVTFAAGASGSVKVYSNSIANNKGNLTVPAYATVSILNNGHADTDGDATADVATTGNVSVVANGTVNVTTNEVGTIEVAGTANVTTNDGLVKMLAGGNATVTTNNGSGVDNTANATVNASNGVIYYEFNEDVNGKLVAKSSKYNTIKLNNITWAPEAAQTIEANVIMINSTIEVWDVDATIIIKGNLKASNTGTNSSYINGVKTKLVTVDSYTDTGIIETPDGIVFEDDTLVP